jgi:hypothetical protein
MTLIPSLEYFDIFQLDVSLLQVSKDSSKLLDVLRVAFAGVLVKVIPGLKLVYTAVVLRLSE